ncbi:V-ATPase V1 sector subunit E [Blastomyces dermatitidis]|uniref:V-type proton ATPase subunit E n=3 Tax=Blastomyces TaxID=229219 RepID=A0A179UUB8_BLAGS|nr:V-type proton ATPase subunit E [Blastomyces gilchristii SLH14081]XP_045274566.1 V-type proton ATPase subunit E [Blastomyces dermatitidis ER-3]EEQ87183.1 V-type proton ATPase subunit E [Blastomyces dermatitidis ER-3]EGE84159.1 V-type proton ATPase subunit E [Blastomyces dermatitidis ATCC 18188]OAT11403.1 V-type proton ATPase subunit E [Blastomyces gilchristii SLH14081]
MSQSHALSDDQVAGELRKMTAFIRQEALEKAREIQLKADEEFAIEKSKLVRQETAAIDLLYEKKFKQAAMSQQITRSTLANKTRLRLLTARQELLDELFDKAREQLADAATDAKGSKKGKGGDVDGYRATLKGLVLEGLYALNERKVEVRARKKDYDIVKKSIEDARNEFKEKAGKDVAVDILENDPLPEESAGGVFIIGTAGKIDINNTFEERLRLLEIDALPAVRETLFGKNKNRKFYD